MQRGSDTIALKLAEVKLESSEAYLLKLGKNRLSWDFEGIHIFSKNVVLYMPISQRFLYLQENKYHFLKVPLLFIRYAKNHRNRWNLSF